MKLRAPAPFAAAPLAAAIMAAALLAAPLPARAELLDVRARATETGAELLLQFSDQPTAATATAIGEHVMVNMAGAEAEPMTLSAPEGAGVRVVEIFPGAAVIELPGEVAAASAELYRNAVVVRIELARAPPAAPHAGASGEGDLLAQVTGRPLSAADLAPPQPKDDRERAALEAGRLVDRLRAEPLDLDARLELARLRMAEGEAAEARFYFGRVLALAALEPVHREARAAIALIDARARLRP